MAQKVQYKTKQMDQIISYLQNLPGRHFSVADICDHFRSEGITVGTTTVYRNLDKLVEQGIVAKYMVDKTSCACFEYIGKAEEGDSKSVFHCKCEQCGKLIHMHCDEVIHLGEHMMEHHGFQIDMCRVIFYGLCKECREKL